MGNTILSDIEEGEILDDEVNSLEGSENNETTLETERDISFDKVEYNERSNSRNDDYDKEVPIIKGKGYMNERLKKMLKLTDEKWHFNPSADKRKDYIYDLILSEDAYKSDSYKNHIFDDCYHLSIYNSGKKKRRKAYVGSTSGTAEDIMSQIDEVVCRKNRCNYKRRRRSSKETKCSWEKFYEKKRSCSHRLKSQESISSHKQMAKNKRNLKCKIFQRDSSSERNEIFRKKLSNYKKIKDDDDYYSGHCLDMKNDEACAANTSNKTIRDFDEVRKNLLEKLKKEREQEQMKKVSENVENSAEQGLNGLKIMTGEKLNNSSNSLNNPMRITEDDSVSGSAEVVFNHKVSETADSETGGDDEMDLVQLRLIALASNKKRKNVESVEINLLKTEKPLSNVEGFSSPELKSDDSRYDDKNGENDLDRNEFLLRAVALKTALVRKHQKSLNKKASKMNQIGTSSDNDAVTSCWTESNVAKSDESLNNATNHKESEDNSSLQVQSMVEDDGFKENIIETHGMDKNNDILESEEKFSEMEVRKNIEEFVPCNGSKKLYLKDRIKRKRKKSTVMLSDVKESGGQDTFDEDCQSLRSQLLHDLIKKKSQCKSHANKSAIRNQGKLAEENPKPAVQVSTNVESAINFQTSKFIQSQPVIPNPQIPGIPNPEIQRIIVHLGSDDSSDDDAVDKISSRENQNVLPPSDNSSVTLPAKNPTLAVKNEIDESARRREYEKKVIQLLGEARKKIEGEMPEAIYKHLPPSQRLEYIRLKQKIAEREKSRKMKNGISSGTVKKKTPESADKTSCHEKPISDQHCTTSNSESKVINPLAIPPADRAVTNAATTLKTTTTTTASAFSKINNIGSAPTCKKVVKHDAASSTPACAPSLVNKTTGNLSAAIKLNAFGFKSSSKTCVKKNFVPSRINASKQSVPNQPSLPNQTLIRKLKFLLAKIKIEKTMEKNYEKEISIMRSKLLLLEKKKNEQRFKIKKLADESVKTYKLIQSEQMRTVSKTEAEVKEKLEMREDATKTDEKSGQVENKEKPDEKEAQMEITVSDPCENPVADQKTEEICPAPETSTANGELIQYSSPLEVFGQGSEKSAKVDPNVIMCQFDLMGICRDEECTYQHVRKT